MTDGTVANETSGPGVRTLPLAIAVVLGIAGARLLMLGTQAALSGGVLLLVGAMGAAAVALGNGGSGSSSVEAAPDLSTRLGLGVLGGVLAGLLHGVLTVVVGWLGVPVLLSAGVDIDLSALQWWGRTALGGVLGFTLGAVYNLLPGRTFVGKGTAFGLLLAAWQLFFVYPFRLGLGFAGLEAGWGLVPLVVLGAVIFGVLAAWAVAWGGRPRDEPLSAPLVP